MNVNNLNDDAIDDWNAAGHTIYYMMRHYAQCLKIWMSQKLVDLCVA